MRYVFEKEKASLSSITRVTFRELSAPLLFSVNEESRLHIGEIHFRARKETFISSKTIISSIFPLEEPSKPFSIVSVVGKESLESDADRSKEGDAVKSGTSCIRRWTLLYARVRVSRVGGRWREKRERGRRRRGEREREDGTTAVAAYARLRASTRIYADGKSDGPADLRGRVISICRFQGRLNSRLTPEYNNSWIQWRASKRNSDGSRAMGSVFRLLDRLRNDINHRDNSEINKIV